MPKTFSKGIAVTPFKRWRCLQEPGGSKGAVGWILGWKSWRGWGEGDFFPKSPRGSEWLRSSDNRRFHLLFPESFPLCSNHIFPCPANIIFQFSRSVRRACRERRIFDLQLGNEFSNQVYAILVEDVDEVVIDCFLGHIGRQSDEE